MRRPAVASPHHRNTAFAPFAAIRPPMEGGPGGVTSSTQLLQQLQQQEPLDPVPFELV